MEKNDQFETVNLEEETSTSGMGCAESENTYLNGKAESSDDPLESADPPSSHTVFIKVEEVDNDIMRSNLEREFEALNPIDIPVMKNLNSMYPCDICQEEFLNYTDLRKHKRNHYIDKRTCNVCDVVCQNLGKLKIHMNLHLGLKPFKCDVCKKNFTCKDQLRVHNRIHTNEKPYLCKHCDKTFRFLGSLRSHEVVHTGLADFKCKKCYKICANKKTLMRHMKLHERETNFKCQLCKKDMGNERNLQQHIKTHKELKYPCDFCQKIHETLYQLKRHIKRAHIPNVCEDCNKVYYDRAEFTKHRKTHKVEEPAVCPLCSKDFKKEKNLREHIRLQHTKDGKTHACPICNKDFINKSLLNNHIKTHDKSFKCTECDRVFSSRYNLETHSVTHTGVRNYQCPVCGNFYATKTGLKNHIDTHNVVKAFQCNQCPKKFKSSRRLYVHQACHITEEKFQCELCDGRFKTKQYLKFHMIKHSQVRPYECKVCNKKFKHKKSWDKHASHDLTNETVVYEEDYECYYCEEYFSTKTAMLEHVRCKHEEAAHFPTDDGNLAEEEDLDEEDSVESITLVELKQNLINGGTHLLATATDMAISSEGDTSQQQQRHRQLASDNGCSMNQPNAVFIKSEFPLE